MIAFGDAFRLTLLTDDIGLAQHADRAGVERIGVDLERIGKADRQAGLDTRLSRHTVEDLARIAAATRQARAFARVNPIHPDSAAEVEAVLAAGAGVVMLPFFRTVAEVERFVRMVDGRAHVMLLVETGAALVRLRDILAVPGIGEVMVGLNDLRLQLGVASHFEVLASPVLDGVAAEVRRAGLPFSVGGIARIDDASLPIPPDLVLAQYPRLHATGAWISRSFLGAMPTACDLSAGIAAARRRLTEWSLAAPESLEEARRDLAARGRAIARA